MTNSLTCFGVGDGWPCADRNHAAFLYRIGKRSILVDCGEPVDRSLKAGGVSYDSIDGVFLSHLHADHVGGLFMLMQGFWLEGRKRALPVHLPGRAIKPLQAMFDAVLLFDELLPFKRRLLPLKSGQPSKLGEITVTPHPSTHLGGLRRRFGKKARLDFSAFCFLIESGKLRIGHSGDLGRPEDLDPLVAGPLDLMVCELSHFTPGKIFSYFQGRRIKKLIFVHLSEAQWKNLSKLRRLAAKMLPGSPHHFARDGETFQF
jgi:ribonuclease BN (tRNA processing enzyme)